MGSAMPLLIVENDATLAELLRGAAANDGYAAASVATFAEAKALIEEGGVEILVTEARLPDGDGLALVELAGKVDPRAAIVVITAHGSIELAVRAMRLGAYDFLTKPVEPEVVAAALHRAVEARRLRSEVERLRAELDTARATMGLVGKSRALSDIAAMIARVADSPATVLVTGPTGSGKERVARALHEGSRRKDAPFVAVNAAAVPEQLLESELFGYTRGAFTDARADKKGLFVEADGGTLFLDEIGDLPLMLQAKLLRVLQEREVRPIGAAKARSIDVRVVAATHQDLQRAIREGRFREDLFYRLAVIEIAVPPLRDRPEDILPLAEHFLRRICARAGRHVEGFSTPAAKKLMGYAWPGNVRELENAVERAVAFAQGNQVTVDDLPRAICEPAETDLFSSAAERLMTLEELERAYVRHVLERLGGNKVRAAAALGINRRTIQRWLGDEGNADEG
ncbi:MAG: sigma-54 dependent transcriptional regulator [Byssovorax sp.]